MNRDAENRDAMLRDVVRGDVVRRDAYCFIPGGKIYNHLK